MVKPFIVYGLITARAGSKSIKNKNLKIFKNLPLVEHSFISSLKSKKLNKLFLSTDSNQILKLCKNYPEIIPIKRPKAISQDFSLDIDVFRHFMKFLKKYNLEIPHLLVHLRPTYPNRKPQDIDKALDYFIENYDKFDSLRSVYKLSYFAEKMWQIKNNKLTPVIKTNKELFNQPRQLLPPTYLQNACIDLVKTSVLVKKGSMSGNRILPYIMNHYQDIDDLKDLKKIENE